MFTERLRNKFRVDEPIFTQEILELFSDYSPVQVFRLIKKATVDGDIAQYDKGIYYIPQETILGKSTITADMIIEKKFLRSKQDVYGVYSGIKLLNNFSLTTQMAAVVEIVTNNESAKYREIQIRNRRYILRKSRFPITKDNYAAYTILQLFSELNKNEKLDAYSKDILLKYIKNTGVTKEQLFSLSMNFPSRTAQYLIGSGIINEIAW